MKRQSDRGKGGETDANRRVCIICKESYRGILGGSTSGTCQSCNGNRHRFKLKYWMVRYKGGRCQLCGYDKCSRSMDFHHVKPGEKAINLSPSFTRSWQTIQAELNKCVLLCKNCHGEVEHEMTLWKQWKKPKGDLLRQVDKIHKRWQPPKDFTPFTRKGWERYHPALMTYPAPMLPNEDDEKEPDDLYVI